MLARVRWRLKPEERSPSSRSTNRLDFFLVSSLRFVVSRLLRARAFVSLLLRASVLPHRRIGRGVVRRGAAGFEQPSVLQGPGRGRLHDLLTDFADLQLETHLGGEGVRVARLEGRRGLSCRRGQTKTTDTTAGVKNRIKKINLSFRLSLLYLV